VKKAGDANRSVGPNQPKQTLEMQNKSGQKKQSKKNGVQWSTEQKGDDIS